jgi:hypothetical protein
LQKQNRKPKYRAFIAVFVNNIRLIDTISKLIYFCSMQIQVLKSKIHRVKVTGADLNYIGSITIDETLLEASNIIEGEKFHRKYKQW